MNTNTMKTALENMLKAVRENLAALEAESAQGTDHTRAIRATRAMEANIQDKINAQAK